MPAVAVEDPEASFDRSGDVERMLRNQFNAKFTYEPAIDFTQINVGESLNNQARTIPLIEELRDAYSEQMLAGNIFPAIICYWAGRGSARKLYACDGNHRIAAALLAGLTTIAVYILDPKTRPEIIDLITDFANVQNGQPPSLEERTAKAMRLLTNKSSMKRAATLSGLTESQVRTAKAKVDAAERALNARINLNEWEALDQSVQVALSKANTNDALRPLVRLAYQAKLKTDEVRELVSDINLQKDTKDQKAIVAARSSELNDRIQKNGAGTFGTASSRQAPGPRQHLSKALVAIALLPDNPATIVKAYGKVERVSAAEAVENAADQLRDIAKALYG